MVKIVVIHGPNLNLLGAREPEIYGRTTLAEINQMIEATADKLGLTVDIHQYNGEGEIIQAIHEAGRSADELNPVV